VVAGKVLVCRHVGAGGRSVCRCSVAHPVGELRACGRAPSSSRPWVRRPAPRRAQPDAAPYVLCASAGLSADGAEVLRRSQQPPGQVPER
jgi:hypothetical protein